MMQPGYAYAWDGVGWRGVSDEAWETEVYTPDGRERREGTREIDGSPVTVFRCSDGVYRAQLSHMVR